MPSRRNSFQEGTSNSMECRIMQMLSFMVRNRFTQPLFDFLTNLMLLENLTKEQYSGNYRRSINVLSASRDTLNPKLNLETLKSRLWVIDHYRYLHGVEHAHWPHFFMKNLGRHLNKYKFNYLVKTFFVYNFVREIRNYSYVCSI